MKKACKRRIVVKIGTKVLADMDGTYGLRRSVMKGLADQISTAVNAGVEVVIVSSGAIGSGMGLLKRKERPKTLTQLQACAAVGQSHLMKAYDDCFRRHRILTAQVLLTQDDLSENKRRLNAKGTLLALLKERVVPIVNENDTVATEEIRFGDNDQLSSLIARLISADMLILLSNIDGLYRYDAVTKKKELLVTASYR